MAGQPGAAQPAAGGQPGGDGPVRAPFLEQQAAALERQLEADPTDSAAALQLGNLYFDLQNWEGAVLAYGRYLELAPADPDVLSDLGVSFQRLGRADEALAMFDRAQQLAPDHWQSRYNEVVVLAFQLQRWDDAREVLGELQRLQPDNPEVARLAQAVEERRNAA
jgi:tetratricopeptide (TPR) repeat protein